MNKFSTILMSESVETICLHSRLILQAFGCVGWTLPAAFVKNMQNRYALLIRITITEAQTLCNQERNDWWGASSIKQDICSATKNGIDQLPVCCYSRFGVIPIDR